MNKTIVVVEDHADISKLIVFHLKNQGYQVVVADNGESGLRAITEGVPDLCLLDIMLPDLSGIELCKKIKQHPSTKNVPIVFLTAKSEESDILEGLESGADDYITKPFSPKVLLARVKAVLRRTSNSFEEVDGEVTERGPLMIHEGKHEVTLQGEKLQLTPSEFEILLLLSKKPGWVFSRNQIVDAIHGQGYAVTDRSIDFQMVGLRKKLSNCGHLIETVRGVGYRFKEL
jgi:two-component system alkaline phosphatase synthesis response regulator PhoP